MNARDEFAEDLQEVFEGGDCVYDDIASALTLRGYRKIFDGDCGLSNVKDPTEREAAEAWMRWANLASNDDIGAIMGMKQMLTELGYRKPRVITDHHADDGPDELPAHSVVLSGGSPAIKQGDGTFMDHDGSTWDSWELELPITVIWEPTA